MGPTLNMIQDPAINKSTDQLQRLKYNLLLSLLPPLIFVLPTLLLSTTVTTVPSSPPPPTEIIEQSALTVACPYIMVRVWYVRVTFLHQGTHQLMAMWQCSDEALIRGETETGRPWRSRSPETGRVVGVMEVWKGG